MERGLQEIASVGLVDGAFVCNSTGEVVASSMPPVLATAAMSDIGRALSQTFGAFEAAGAPIDRLDLAFDTWRLYVRDLGQGLVVVIAEPDCDAACLRMTVDIITTGWASSGVLQKRIGKGKTSARMDLLSRANLDDAAWLSLRPLIGQPHSA